MGMTMTQKIMAAHTNEAVKVGEYIYCDLDMVLGNDITAPVAIEGFNELNKPIFHKSKVALVPDHFTPNKDIKSAEQCKIVRDFAIKHEIEHYFEIGQMGIEHALLPEKGLVKAGDMIIGADSHTCTFGALGAFSTGVGSTDLGCAMATGKCWFRVPDAIKVVITGKKQGHVSGKDVILYLIGKIGVDGARYKSLEFTGQGIEDLTMDDRFTISNMAIEAGAKNGIFPVDEKTKAYMDEKGLKYRVYEADEDADYVDVVNINLDELTPQIAKPHLPSNTVSVKDIEEIHVDQVVIGSCTNGRISDIKAAADVLRGNKIKKGMRLIVFPATQKIYLEAMEAGYLRDIIEAGGIISTPTCGPCLGGHMGILAAGEKCLATTNRNFIGRMGHKTSEVYLASPAVAAATSIAGYITMPGGQNE
ncbi:3-isopropylmalate dehydratase large subunit [Acidaminobacter sp. JC074]|uniref:3-isopropylmalate dehydratase large subunit n=1 Tax=Acidaminobacter sp. JC074 TaxID=2530199 RepID=UPI001F1035FC|nr:3-isopropylmalate dehydratase large subunit [Acidaminobacter sp. JC074]MCH4890581.1 3-isopropylmalate dehydratase large subunit [Acidaminobacter sp. JC074]